MKKPAARSIVCNPAAYHQFKIAKQTLRAPDAMVGVMGGPTKDEARAHLRVVGWSEARIAAYEAL